MADRDFALETLSAASICAVHLSRFAEEIVLWMTPQFAFIQLSDKFTTGSSIIGPQKKNPDAAELIRGKSGRIFGALQALLVVMKGLPLTYSKDMQEDKEGMFDALQSLSLCLAAMTAWCMTWSPIPRAMKRWAGAGFATATDLADWLVARPRHALPRRPPRHRAPRRHGGGAEDRAGETHAPHKCNRSSRALPTEIFKVLGVECSVKSRVSYGGTAPANVKRQARRWLTRLEKERPA